MFDLHLRECRLLLLASIPSRKQELPPSLRHQGELGKSELARPDGPKELQASNLLLNLTLQPSTSTPPPYDDVPQADEAVG